MTEPGPGEYALHDLTVIPLEQLYLAHPTYATDAFARSAARMLRLLLDQLAARWLVPVAGEVPGYRTPSAT